MRPAKYFYDKPLPKYLDPKTVLIYLPHPVDNHVTFGTRTRTQKIFPKNIQSSYFFQKDIIFKIALCSTCSSGAGVKNRDGNTEGWSSNPGNFTIYFLFSKISYYS